MEGRLTAPRGVISDTRPSRRGKLLPQLRLRRARCNGNPRRPSRSPLHAGPRSRRVPTSPGGPPPELFQSISAPSFSGFAEPIQLPTRHLHPLTLSRAAVVPLPCGDTGGPDPSPLALESSGPVELMTAHAFAQQLVLDTTPPATIIPPLALIPSMGGTTLVWALPQRDRASLRGLRLSSRWSFPLLSLSLLAVGAAALLHSSANSDTSSDASASSTTTTIYGNHLHPLLEEKDGTQTLNIYGPGNRIVAQVLRDDHGNETVRYLVGDHLGSTRVALDAAGNPIGAFDYSPFGQTSASGAAADSVRPRYTGQRHDPALDTYHFPARAYDPQTGRFLSVDPARGNPSPYLYASNNPLGRVDLSGKLDAPFIVVDYNSYPGWSKPALQGEILRWLGLPDEYRDAFLDIAALRRPQGGAGMLSFAEQHPARVLGGRTGDIVRTRVAYYFYGRDTAKLDIPNHLAAWSSLQTENLSRMGTDLRETLDGRVFLKNILVHDPEHTSDFSAAMDMYNDSWMGRSVLMLDAMEDTIQPGASLRRLSETIPQFERSEFRPGQPGAVSEATASPPGLQSVPFQTHMPRENLQYLSDTRPGMLDWHLKMSPQQQADYAMGMPHPLGRAQWDNSTFEQQHEFLFGNELPSPLK